MLQTKPIILYLYFMEMIAFFQVESKFDIFKMGQLDLFEIAFDRQPPVYFGGQYVSGNVNVKLNDGMKIKNLQLKFHGEAKV